MILIIITYMYLWQIMYIYMYMFYGFCMKPKQNTLADEELLILLEGDVSGLDLNMSDDELDFVSNRNEHAVPTSRVSPGMDREMIKVRVGEEVDLDHMPFAHANIP